MSSCQEGSDAFEHVPETRNLEAQYQVFPELLPGVRLRTACERDRFAEANGEVVHQTRRKNQKAVSLLLT